MNKAKKFGLGLGTLALAYVVAPLASYAQEFSTSTAAETVTDTITDVSVIIAAVVGAIVGLLAALIGLGWGIRKFQRHVSGRKF